MSPLQPLLILMYKNVRFRYRCWIFTLAELFVPVMLFYAIVYAKNAYPSIFGLSVRKNETTLPPINERELYHEPFLSDVVDIFYTPTTNFTTELIQLVQELISVRNRKFAKINIVGVRNEPEMELRFYKLYHNRSLETNQSLSGGLGIVFQDLPVDGSKPLHLKYKIRPASDKFNTEDLVQDSEFSTSELSPYVRNNFLPVYIALNQAYIYRKTKVFMPKFYLGPFPVPSYQQTVTSYKVISFFLPAVTVGSYLILVPLLMKNIVLEKETGGKELMKMMGYQSWMLWLGWLLNTLMVCCLSATIISVLMVTDVYNKGPIFHTMDATILFVFLLLYCLVITLFCFALSPIFSRSVKAMFWGIVIWVLSCGVPEVMFKRSSYKYLISFLHLFLPNAVLNKGWESIIYLEQKGYGVTWENIFLQPTDGKTYSLIAIFYILLFHCLVLWLVTWYLDAVCTSPYGISKPWNFFLKFSFWCNCLDKSVDAGIYEKENGWNENFESSSQKLQIGIQIQNISKQFDGMDVVENLTLDIYKDQITTLLGHNGAGKTTAMSMLTGVLPPSSGKVIVNGKNVFENLPLFRANLGLCPQQNLHFNYLSVLEHLIFFGMIKKLSKSEATAQGLNLLKLLRIENKKNAKPTRLSGGMKRKLSLAIALMGSPQILMLDEPTSGMDPESRREMWDLLLTLRGQRTILITTHHMEEAEALGDQIVIMSHGKVKCYGSPMFLKKKFGAHYYLKITKESNTKNQTELLTALIHEFIPNNIKQIENGSQLVFALPLESIHRFPDMLSKFESMGISNFSISSTTLEEVFFKVGGEQINGISTNVEDQQNFPIQPSNGHYLKGRSPIKVHSSAQFGQQFKALLIKKWTFTRRKGLFYFLFGTLPVLIGFTACKNMNAYISEQVKHYDLPGLVLDSKIYGAFLHYRSSNSLDTAAMFENLIRPPLMSKQMPNNKNIFKYLLNIAEDDIIKYFNENLGAVDFRGNVTTVLYNQYLIHSLPLIMSLIYNSVSLTKLDGFQITTTIHPLFSADPYHKEFEEQKRKLTLLFMWGVLFASSIMTFAGCFILFPHTERVNKAKQLQLMTGVSSFTYWITSFVVDYLYAASVFMATLLCIRLSDEYGILSNSPEFELLTMTIFLYGFAVIIFAYFCSYFQKTFATAFFTYFIISIVLGGIGSCVVFNFQELDYYFHAKSPKMDITHYILLLLPHYSVSMLLFSYIFVAWNNKCRFRLVQTEDPCIEREYWTFRDGNEKQYGVNGSFFALAVDILFFVLLVVCLECNIFRKLHHTWTKILFGTNITHAETDSEDTDVQMEKEIVERSKKKQDYQTSILTVDNLQKKFSKNFAAVRGVDFVVRPGECFGLLGVNGAGKTTTFRMLTGDLSPTKGGCVVLTTALSSDRKRYLSRIGYCPQFDALNEVMSADEMLTLFATLRGVDPSNTKEEVNHWINELDLSLYRSRKCGYLSGGVKRRLSTAMALIGEPQLVILDEPTSGVDPVSRRNLWSTLTKCCQKGQSIIVTSHSMDECEEICDRLTIMASGKMRCIGSIPHLKRKYGQGFTIMIKLKPPYFGKVEVQRLKQEMENLFITKIVLKDEHLCLLSYHVTDPKIPLSQLYSALLSIQKKNYIVEDFTISETTLEQVFIAFAKNKLSVTS